MPRENADERAKALLVEGRLEVRRVVNNVVVARARSDTGEVYDLGFDPGKREWRCTCEASAKFGRRCHHLRALQLVALRPAA